jgi:hypothetical protein
MNKEYSNLQNRKIYLYRALFLCLGIYSVFLILSLSQNELNINLKVIKAVSIWSLIVYLIPLLIIYFDYYKSNNNSTFKISGKIFLYSENNEVIEFGINEIEKVVFNLSYPLFDKRIRLFFWDEYFYTQIKLKNGRNIFITCLLCDELEIIIPTNLIERKKRIFPLINKKQKTQIVENNVETGKRNEKLTLIFKEKSKSELIEIINNRTKYQKEAVEIANQLLKEKTLGNTV